MATGSAARPGVVRPARAAATVVPVMDEEVHQRTGEEEQVGQRVAPVSRSTVKATTRAKPVTAMPVRLRHHAGFVSAPVVPVRSTSRHPHPNGAEVLGH
jgi:hypothetical protein